MNKVFFWGILLVLTGLFTHAISDVLAPFLIAFVFAYILQPIIDRNCQKYGIGRRVVSIFIFLIFVSSFVLIMLILVPIIYNQVALFVKKIPQYRLYFQKSLTSLSESVSAVDPEASKKVIEAATAAMNSMFSIVTSFANHIWEYTIATINIFTIIALVPIILYYFMRDWTEIVETAQSLMPENGKSKIREIIISINQLLSAYIRGQLIICLLLTVYYVIGLSLIGIDLALLLGILSGFLIIIPFIGALASFFLAVLSCYVTFGPGAELLYVTGLFVFGHTVEGYILAPKIIGNKIGLHPVWILFSVFAAGSLFGFIGILFAIPIAGIVKVLLSHSIDYYKSTRFFRE